MENGSYWRSILVTWPSEFCPSALRKFETTSWVPCGSLSAISAPVSPLSAFCSVFLSTLLTPLSGCGGCLGISSTARVRIYGEWCWWCGRPWPSCSAGLCRKMITPCGMLTCTSAVAFSWPYVMGFLFLLLSGFWFPSAWPDGWAFLSPWFWYPGHWCRGRWKKHTSPWACWLNKFILFGVR